MLGLGGMMKLARGGIGADELAEVLSAAGIEISINAVTPRVESFRPLAASASLPSSKLVELRGKMKNGDRLHALLVITESSAGHHGASDSAGVL
jgi:hypothetical protein